MPCLHADRPHGQEDCERLPDAVVQAVLADGVDVDLIDLAQNICCVRAEAERVDIMRALDVSRISCRRKDRQGLGHDQHPACTAWRRRLRRTFRKTSKAMPAVTSPKTLTPNPGPGKGWGISKPGALLSRCQQQALKSAQSRCTPQVIAHLGRGASQRRPLGR